MHEGKKVPPESVRRVGFFYSPGEKKAFDDFMKFFQDMALKVSKKPLYVDTAFTTEWSAGLDAVAAVALAKKEEAVAVVCLFTEEDKDRLSPDLEEACGKDDIFFRAVALPDAMKRGSAVELVVDLMLARSS